MKISIVTISFNQADFLKRCIESVLSQENVNLEYIVVDPGSSDGSRSIIESYGQKITSVFNPDDGPSDGLNNGFKIATGDVFGFINADDFLLPGSLSIISNHFRESGLEHFTSGYGFTEWPTGKRKRVMPTCMTKTNLLYGACTVFQQSTFFPAYMFREIGGFNPHNKTCWDAELFIDFICRGYTHMTINHTLAVFSLYPSSISGSGRLNTQYKTDMNEIFYNVTRREKNSADIGLSYFLRCLKKIKQFIM